jgi:hypothetical protein
MTKTPDPFIAWREVLDRLEKSVDASVSQGLASSPGCSEMLGRAATLPFSVQQIYAKVLAAVLATLDLPSRTDLSVLEGAVQRIEDKLDRLLPPPAEARQVPRTRRPAAQAPTAQVTAVPAPAPKVTRAKAPETTAKPAPKSAEAAAKRARTTRGGQP